jgi:hypothetical protein
MILNNLQNGGRGPTRSLKLNQQPQPKRPPHATDDLERNDLERNMATATVPLCQHWMDNATRCGSPAMRGTRYCYSHHLQQARGARKNAERARQRWFESAPLEDAASVQRALMQVMTRLLSGSIAHKQAGQILYRLQTASVNLRGAGPGPGKANDESS